MEELEAVRTQTPDLVIWQAGPILVREREVETAYELDYGTHTGTVCVSPFSGHSWFSPEEFGGEALTFCHHRDYLIPRLDPVIIGIHRSESLSLRHGSFRLGHLPLLEKERSQLELRLSYRNPEAVESYLDQTPEVEDFLEAAQPALFKYFGTPVHVVLELIRYPDDADDHEELVGWIQSPDDVHEGLDKLERFNDEWFLDRLDQVHGKFSFNIETI